MQSKIKSYGQQLYSKHRTTINHGLLNLQLQTSDLLLQERKLVVGPARIRRESTKAPSITLKAARLIYKLY
jgi:hypothetical protein